MQIRERTSSKQYLFPVQSFLAIEPNSQHPSDCSNVIVFMFMTRLEICQEIYTTKFLGERILHTENA